MACLKIILSFFFALTLSLEAADKKDLIQYKSAFMRVEPAKDQPAFVALAVDSLGKNKLGTNLIRHDPKTSPVKFGMSRRGRTTEYRFAGASSTAPPAWSFEFSPKQICLRSYYSDGNVPPPLVLDFDPEVNHATLLGLMYDNGQVNLPALLHLPDHGTIHISSPRAKSQLGYDAFRNPDMKRTDDYVRITFPAASRAEPKIEYVLEVTTIHPRLPAGLEHDPRFDGFRRNWLNIFQLNPRLQVLANHAASDPCAFTVFMYSSMALRTPPLAPGLTALDLVRQTLDRYIGGMKAYGMAGYSQYDKTTYLDTYPSLLLAAHDYGRGSQDWAWLENNYPKLREWASAMLETDRDGNGLLEYELNGNSGSWARTENPTMRPSNWWDTVGFGHEDAYANALAYRALLGMTELALMYGNIDEAESYENRATKIQSAYFDTFYNPATGVLAGWKSKDGKLHDYYFTFVNGTAVTYGLVTRDQGNRIMDNLLAKMKQVGYNKFEYGLPGNLVPIRQEDYAHLDKRWGGPEKEDGSDAFQIYENGGATASFAYFTIEALYKLGRQKDGDKIMLPMLRAFERGSFQGRGPKGMTYDWKAWDGTPHGYEGLLVDGYQALLAILSR